MIWLIVIAGLWSIGLVVYLVQLGAARMAARESCGCRNVTATYGCMRCGRTACPAHRDHACPDPDPEPCNPLLERRLEDIPLPAHIAAPQVVAGQDLNDSLLIGEIYKACDDYRHAVDIFAGARHEPSPEVQR